MYGHLSAEENGLISMLPLC